MRNEKWRLRILRPPDTVSGTADGVGPSVNAATLDGHTAEDLQASGAPGPEGPRGLPGQDAPTELLLIALGTVSRSGPVLHGTDNFTASWDNSEGRYVIVIDGLAYLVGSGGYNTFITPACSRPPAGGVDSLNGDLLVQFEGGQQCMFQFIIYKSP